MNQVVIIRPFILFTLLILVSAASPCVRANNDPIDPKPTLSLPRVDRPPTLEDFLEMKPGGEFEGRLSKAEGFIQQRPRDGEPATQRTEAYFCYDDKNLYVIWLCFDTEPEKIRARMARRENAFDDDWVEITLDTFRDQRRGYVFWSNPLGVQAEAIWSEDAQNGQQGPDFSFDTVWYSRGRLTDKGYVVWMQIPFRSLRFSSASPQSWGITLLRVIPHASNEWSYWPRVSSRVQGRLTQAATMTDLSNISPGRNIQLIPYGSFRSFRALDARDANRPRFATGREFDGGLDAKIALKENLVLDVTVNPDFAQVESDEPQVTVNQRFEVFFPERRPFFLENSDFFRTPINLLFTRRIADPQFGARLTGKLGRYSIGAMVIDDQAPGRSVLPGDPLFGKRALFGVVRINRDILKQSSIGVIYTDREFAGGHNRVGGIDGRFRINANWVARFQAVASATEWQDGSREAGPAYDFSLERSGRKFQYNFQSNDRSSGFRALAGFIPRTDIRHFQSTINYRFRPEGRILIAWGPRLNQEANFDHSGTRLDWFVTQALNFEFTGRTQFSVFQGDNRERLRAKDLPGLARSLDFSSPFKGFVVNSSYIRQATIQAEYFRYPGINFAPPAGREPFLTDRTNLNLTLTLRPLRPLRVDNTYIFSRAIDRPTGANVFNNHIIRTKFNWQFSRELSLRTILQYNTVLANPSLTSLQTTKNFNTDFLIAWQLNPGTALYVGYNSNLQNLDLIQTPRGVEIVRYPNRFINDGKQLFIKFSWLFRL
ncbi:MAG TPA: DUF5916 domain-containing protein [Blastocatellia bacterium]|nr:DUF5916 domain-containing protein [Blastocatellia bacterium]